ncbi:porin family protein [Confluentibacter citreus]|uniref:porin family protein n=1 Tax=Confluentibacter citreus TaxID=2007307 RepID=UPI000C2886F8|nr:porin family protein [Confluentibacter citreus]
MKTILKFLFILSATLTIQAQAQQSNSGIKAGYNLAAVSFDGDTETGQRHGFHIGLYGESFISESTSLQIEVLYSQQGYELRDDSGTFTQKLDYINLPLLLKLYPDENFFLEVGPQVGLAISHKEEFDSSFNLFDTSQEFEPDNFDWGVNLGAGFKTDSGVSLGVRYHLGLGSVYDEGHPKNRVWQFSLGFDF